MPKRREVDYMKWLPVAGLVISFVAGYATLNNRVATAEEKIKENGQWLSNQILETSKMQVSQARQEAKVDAILEAIKDLKNSK